MTFKHSGARGDLIYSLPALQALGGGILYINARTDHFFGSVSEAEMDGIVEFLKTQSYLEDVRPWNWNEVDYNLDEFRLLNTESIYLPVAYLLRFGVQYDLNKSWIDTEKIPAAHRAEIIVSRTDRYHSPFDWGELAPWTDRTAFVGTKAEHTEFMRRTGLVVRYEATNTWMALASVIRGSKIFIGNQSFAYSLAEAMKHPRVLEVCSICPNCDPHGENGHVRLSQGVIRKYLLGEEFQEAVRISRLPKSQMPFARKKAIQNLDQDVSAVIFGEGPRVQEFVDWFRDLKAEVLHVGGPSFEQAVNRGAASATRGIICVVDATLSPSMAAVGAVIEGVMTAKVGMAAMSTSTICVPHVSGSCFAVSRNAYERAGLFNEKMRPGEVGMAEMCLRYARVGIACRSVGIPGWTGRVSSPEDNRRNLAYVAKNFGVVG